MRVAAVDLLQAKSRWLPEEFGYVPSGQRTRRKLLAKWEADPAAPWCHATLTYDPKRWEGAKGCYDASRAKRHIGEFVRRLRRVVGKFQYFRVIEFQKNGMPHYHILIDRKFIDHALLTRCWGWGFVFITSASAKEFRYVSKYVTKGIDPPEWLLDYGSSIRLSSTGRGFWGAAAARSCGSAAPGRRLQRRTIREVRANPRRHLRVMMRLILDTGEMMYRCVAMDIGSCFSAVHALGMELADPLAKWEGQIGMVARDGESVSLDQLLHCGTPPIAIGGGGP